MTMAPNPIQDVKNEVEFMRDWLEENGWKVVNGPGDMASPNGVTWFCTGYVHGEFTVTCFGRNRGSGPAVGTTRVRITQTRLENHPGLGLALARALNNAARIVSNTDFPGDITWPPAEWAELAQ